MASESTLEDAIFKNNTVSRNFSLFTQQPITLDKLTSKMGKVLIQAYSDDEGVC